MTTPEIALIMFGSMLLLLAGGIWISIALCITAWIGIARRSSCRIPAEPVLVGGSEAGGE